MTDFVVTAVIPPKASPGARSRQSGPATSANRSRRVSMPRLASIRERSWAYSVAAVDDRGRIAVPAVVRSLGWASGTGVAFREHGGLVVVTADPRGASTVSAAGYLRVPAPIRHWCGLEAGSRVLLVADRTAQRLVMHPPASLDAMIIRQHVEVFGGDAA